MTIHPSQLLDFLGSSKAARFGTDRVEVRSLSFIVYALFFYQLVEPGFYISSVSDSLFYKVAQLSHMRAGISAAFFVLAALIVPHLVNLVFFPDRLDRKLPRKLAGYAAIGGAFVWGFLGYRAWPLDYDWLSGICMLRASIDLWMGVLLGISVNAQQAREAKEAAEARRDRNNEGEGQR